MCVNRSIQDCQYSDRSMFEPALRAATVICKNTDAYRKALQCYFNSAVEEIVDICTENLGESDMSCGSILAYQTCITADNSLRDHCSALDITLLGNITTASIYIFIQKYNCIVTTRSTTLPSTIKTSTASLSTLSTTASRTTKGTNNPNYPGPNTDEMEGGAASLAKCLVLSLMTLFCAVIAMYA
ncbi:hypothetical protein LOTGIDRAFT_239754 [Lottia gigantea]|uniref:Uncharacterized protein n=1 Tax=Lottia gigantea TaxID=225164 RepID=V4C228_LOTGI|nr:hypothetical protein LOTGIDRAFT_239754 [Lottia gigantea]ESO95539.1 hypothetical protein LOTGIDRAFT_239754 [Lottia gigantea]